jgi:nickel-dependent lactate racemase
MDVILKYGNEQIALKIPQTNIERIIRPWQESADTDNEAVIRQALTNSDAENFKQKVQRNRICVLTDDGTRNEPFEDTFGELFKLLRTCSSVQFLICTGTHDADTDENNSIKTQIEIAARKAGIADFQISTHDCDTDSFINAGCTSRGTEVLYNEIAETADLFLVLSDLKVHYFSGYSNPIKNLLPGICAFKTTEQNHSLALDENSTFGRHPWHLDKNRITNPVAEDQLEGMRLIVKDRPVFALITITTSGKINWAGFGPVQNVTAKAFNIADEKNTHTVKPTDKLIISPGGLPNDISLYIAQRALELSKNAVNDGGEILFLAACPDGVGEKKTIENFYNRLTAPIDEVLESISGDYKLFSHKPYKFAQLIKRLRRIWVYSQIPADIIEAAHLFPTKDPQKVVDDWLAENPKTKITLVEGANKIALYAKA